MGNDLNAEKERLYTPQQSRNKLGTVFNEKIVVSPVPFAVSTRESFSTLKTIPIRFMGQALEISSSQGDIFFNVDMVLYNIIDVTHLLIDI